MRAVGAVLMMLSAPCDTPTSPRESLKHSQDGIFAHLDFSRLSSMYASKNGIYHPDRVGDRAKLFRQWIRQREEDVIVGAHKP